MPGSWPLGSAVTRGSSGTRKNTNSLGQTSAVAAVTRAVGREVAGESCDLDTGWKDAPPLTDRAIARPSASIADGVFRVPQVTYTSPSASIAMSQPCTSLPSESWTGFENVCPESVDRLKRILVRPLKPTNRDQQM